MNVFINCPFDDDYDQMFFAIVFTVLHCRHNPTSAREAPGSGKARYARLIELVKDSPLSIHDLSRTTIDGNTGMPRFNMPFELGLYVGAVEFGGEAHKEKDYLVLERNFGDCGRCCSDLGGTDPKAHGDDIPNVIRHVRDWLNGKAGGGFAGKKAIQEDYHSFREDLPSLLASYRQDVDEVDFVDLRKAMREWLEERQAITTISKARKSAAKKRHL